MQGGDLHHGVLAGEPQHLVRLTGHVPILPRGTRPREDDEVSPRPGGVVAPDRQGGPMFTSSAHPALHPAADLPGLLAGQQQRIEWQFQRTLAAAGRTGTPRSASWPG
ncbi:hypothetical protein GCM10027610_018020 [Dactylosporangium cerinum]